MPIVNNDMSNTDWSRVTTSVTVFEIIEKIDDLNGAELTELANELGLAKSTVHRHLSTLIDLEYLVKEENKYYLGHKFVKLSNHVRKRKDPALKLAEPKVKQVAEQTGERTQFMVEEHGKVAYTFLEMGSDNAVATGVEEGRRIPIHVSSSGKAILAELPDERVHEILDNSDLVAWTENTIVSKEEMFKELEQIMERGYAMNWEESMEGLRTIAVPVAPKEKGVIGALSISGPAHRFNGEKFTEEFPNLLLGVANELELDIEYSDDI